MKMETGYRDPDGLRFLVILIGGIIAMTIALAVVVGVWGHFSAPDPGLI